ncbi:MAG TPA: M91 family zinc metallopeptidase, partial [Polyangia bacterium]
GTYDVQWTSAGTVHQGRSDGRGRTRPYPPIGIRHPINHNGRPLDALLVQRNPDGSHEVEANLNGERRSGRLPMGSNVVNWYPMPPRGNYVPNTPIAGHVPVQTPTADGGLVTTIGNIEIVHPAPTPLDALPHVHNDRVNFVNGVLNDLTMIQSTPSGQALLNSLQNNGGHSAGPVRIQFTPGYNYFADDEAAASHGNDGDFDHSNTLPGTGAGATVTYNPAIQGTPVRPTGDNTGTDAGLVRYLSQGSLRAHQWPSDSILFHELVHADDARRGIGFDNSFGGSHVGPSEERAVGLGDFSAAPYSENTYLVDRGLPPRAFYGAAGAGEVYSTTATRNGLDAGWLLSSHTGPGTPTSRPPVPPKPKITPASSVAGLYATSSNASTTSISGDSIANFMDNDLGGPGGAGGGGGGPPGPGGDGGPPGGGGGGPPGGSGGPSGTGMGGPSGTGTPNTGGFVAGGPTPSGSGSGVPSTTSAPTNTAGLYDHMNVSSDSLGSQNSYAPSDWSAAQGSHHGALQTGASHPPAPPRPTTEPNTNAGSSDGVPSTAPPSNGPLIVPGGPQPGSQDCG